MYKNTTDFDIARQVLTTVNAIQKEKWLLGWLALEKWRWEQALKSTKLERKEMIYTPVKLSISTAITSWYFDNTNKNVSVSSWAIQLQLWDIITFQTSSKNSRWNLSIIVTAVTNDTTFTAQKVWGSDIAIVIWDLACVKSSSLPEGSRSTNYKGIRKPRNVYNYPQNFRVSWELTREAARLMNNDFEKMVEELLRQISNDYSNNLNGIAMSSSRRGDLVINGETIKIAGWLPFFIENNFNDAWNVIAWTPANVINVWGLLTKSHIDNAFQYVIEQGGSVNSILCSPAQARVISTFESWKINLVVMDKSVSSTIGWAVQVLESPIKVWNNTINEIYVDASLPNDVIYIFNRENVNLVPVDWAELIWMELVEPYKWANIDKDIYSMSWLAEWTFYYKNALESAYCLKWLTY